MADATTVTSALTGLPVDFARGNGNAGAITARIPGRCPAEVEPVAWWTAVLAILVHRYTGDLRVPLLGEETADGLARVHTISVSPADTVGVVRSDAAAALAAPVTVALTKLGGRRCPAGVTVSLPRRGPAAGGRSGARADLELLLGGDGRSATLAASGGLWAPDTLARMAGHLARLAHAAASPDAVSGQIDLLDPAERARIVSEWNATDAIWPVGGYIDLLRAQAERDPDGPALVGGDRVVSFGELESSTNRMARWLHRAGAAPGERVGLLANRGVDFALATVGILKSGASVVPLDPVNPDARLASMIADCAPIAVLATAGMRERIGEGPAYLPLDARAFDSESPEPPSAAVTGDTVSHLIYTSGSTGEPKAVAERHSALVNLVHWTRRAYGVRPGDRASWMSTPGFAVQLMEWMPYLALGAAVHVADNSERTPWQVRDWLVAEGITHTMLVAAMAERVWALDWPADGRLRVMVTTAERVHAWPPADTAFAVVMTYGSTETTNVLTCLDLGAGLNLTAQATSKAIRAARPVPVGRPMANQRVYILDAADQPVPVGIVGRLHVAGAGVAFGYFDRPELTAAKFRHNPLPEERSPVLYETGDLARYRADGAVELLGREDSQVKVRGFRVELGEVETAVAGAPNVAEAAVTTRVTEPDGQQLVAHVVPEPGQQVRPGALRSYLAKRLPHYMVPSLVISLPRLPRLPNGKVDLRSLREDGAGRAHPAGGGVVTARNEIEARLVREWQRLFAIEQIGVHDNFFELGGYSLLAFRLIDDIRASLGAELSLPDLYHNPTVARLAERVAAARDGDAVYFGGMVPLEPRPEHRYDPFPLTESQQALWIGRSDAVALGNVGCHGYFEWDGDLDPERFARAWRELVLRHDALRTVISPDGTQRVLARPPDFDVPVLDLRLAGTGAAGQALARLRERLSHQVMADDQWPLFDVRITLLPPGLAPGCRTRLHLSLDFLIMDAWSYFQVLIPDLVHLYERPGEPLPDLKLTFRDYVVGVNERLPGSDLFRRSELYWRDRLAALPPAPRLPRRPATQAALPARFDRRKHQLDPRTWDALLARGNEIGVTGSVLLTAAFAEVLRAWSGQPRFTLNFPLFNRLPLHPDVHRIIGDTTSTLLLAVEKSDGTFAERMVALQQQLWTDLEHRYFGGVSVLRELTKQRGTMVPAMPVVMTSLAGHPPRHHAACLGDPVYSISQTPQVEVDFQVFEVAGRLEFNWDYLPALFPDGLIDAMFADYCAILGRLSEHPAAWEAAAFTLGHRASANGHSAAQVKAKPASATSPSRPSAVAVGPSPAAGAAWERFWSGVRLTGPGGDVLWDPGSQDEIDWCLGEALSRMDRALPVVDAGCGNGRFTRALAAHCPAAVGVDVSPSAVREAERESAGLARVSFRVLDITRPGEAAVLADELGDCNIFVRAVFHVLDDTSRAAAAAALAELAGSRGAVMLVEPAYEEGGFGYIGRAGGAQGRAADLVRPLERAGVGRSRRFAGREVSRFFPAGDGWLPVVSGTATLRAIDPGDGVRTILVPGFYAVLRRG